VIKLSRIRIFTGHFGSGKTEIAINYAIKLLEEGKKVAIVDLDIVNPYFCVRGIRDFLEGKGMRVISSKPSLMNAELMVVPAEVNSIFNDKSYDVVIDVGGDDSGALVLGQYYRYFNQEDYDMYFVVNNNRPFTLDSINAEEYIKNIERASRLKVTHLISNTNLSYETEVKHILAGDKIILELSERTGIPYKYTVCRKDLLDRVRDQVKGELLPIDIFMKRPWED
jgi:hypothetical protein